MKRSVVTFLLAFISPILAFGDDHCTKPKEYTIDKRCYVTDEQKKEKPYNAVVKVEAKEKIQDIVYTYMCSGVVAKLPDGKLYVYTAKHCVKRNDGALHKKINITTPAREIMSVTYKASGVKDAWLSDFAIYEVPTDKIHYVNVVKEELVDKSYPVKRIGYGNLGIMSDKSINDFHEKYIKYLKDTKKVNSNKTEVAYGWKEGGLDLLESSYPKNFIDVLKKNDTDYYNSIFEDGKSLKVSECTANPANTTKITCQIWSGDSGGGLFDKNGDLVAMLLSGNLRLGGTNHAKAVNTVWNLPTSWGTTEGQKDIK